MGYGRLTNQEFQKHVKIGDFLIFENGEISEFLGFEGCDWKGIGECKECMGKIIHKTIYDEWSIRCLRSYETSEIDLFKVLYLTVGFIKNDKFKVVIEDNDLLI